jgi:signal transduction histidine kinase
MFSFRNLPIKYKLTLLSVLASSSALILACASFVIYDMQTFRAEMVQQLSTQAKIVGYNSAAALLFHDSKSSNETLAALSAEPDIVAAGIYSPVGKSFATYRLQNGDERATALPAALQATNKAEHRFAGGYLELSRPIIYQGENIGTIHIRASLDVMTNRLLRYIGIATVVLLISIPASIVISQRLQRRISRPIAALAETAKTISIDKDYSVRATASSRDEVGHLVLTFNDMLARIQEQNAELQGARDEMEQRVIARTAQLEIANKELESFSYSVSHDLRAPLRGIDGFSQALLEDYGDRLDAQGKSYLQRVRAASQRMAELIDDMLSLSRVSRGEMKSETVDLGALAQSVAVELQNADRLRQVEFTIAAGLLAKGDARLLRVVLENLLRNAWKFTGKNSAAKIEVGVDRQNGQPVYFVRDDGAGFDMAYAEKLFGAFQRLHSSAEFQGTGIGLATVQRVIRRHGGRVWAESKVGQGATFYFTL